ncbi:MAG: stage II sporulation protein R [Clostridia bacterium]|nr:stage II sporulation protein R [Clostridia bacterium]
MKQIFRKNIELGVIFGLICAILLSFANFEVRCDELRQGVLRLHIIANSDSQADQAIKLAVRDEILKSSTDIFKNCDNLVDAIITADTQLKELNQISNDVIKKQGFGYTAKSSVGDSYFDTRVYDDFTLPAGEYKSLIVKLGEGKGKNWWCVVFPCVCVPTARGAELDDSVSEVAAKTAENASDFKIKFKSIEIYEEIKKIFSKK